MPDDHSEQWPPPTAAFSQVLRLVTEDRATIADYRQRFLDSGRSYSYSAAAWSEGGATRFEMVDLLDQLAALSDALLAKLHQREAVLARWLSLEERLKDFTTQQLKAMTAAIANSKAWNVPDLRNDQLVSIIKESAEKLQVFDAEIWQAIADYNRQVRIVGGANTPRGFKAKWGITSLPREIVVHR